MSNVSRSQIPATTSSSATVLGLLVRVHDTYSQTVLATVSDTSLPKQGRYRERHLHEGFMKPNQSSGRLVAAESHGGEACEASSLATRACVSVSRFGNPALRNDLAAPTTARSTLENSCRCNITRSISAAVNGSYLVTPDYMMCSTTRWRPPTRSTSSLGNCAAASLSK